jgi:hypothetical protein
LRFVDFLASLLAAPFVPCFAADPRFAAAPRFAFDADAASAGAVWDAALPVETREECFGRWRTPFLGAPSAVDARVHAATKATNIMRMVLRVIDILRRKRSWAVRALPYPIAGPFATGSSRTARPYNFLS